MNTNSALTHTLGLRIAKD